MRKIMISLAFLAINTATMSQARAETAIDGVIECSQGQMTYDANGWLVDYHTMARVNYHQIEAVTPNNAMSDEIWMQSINGQTVKVCKENANLVYTVQHHIVLLAFSK